MQPLKTINPENVDENSVYNWERREAARAVVFDGDGNIGLLHVKAKNYYKLPGGGVEKGEDIKTALDRECEEELGVKIEVTGEVGKIIEFRAKFKVYQASYCYIAKVISEKKDPIFTEDERENKFEAVWVKPDEALKLLNLKQTTDYEGKFIEERDFCFLNTAISAIWSDLKKF